VVRKKRKASFEVSGSSLVVYGTFSTGKRRLSAGEYCLDLHEKHWKNNGILFKNW
jgi:hypothetical protein